MTPDQHNVRRRRTAPATRLTRCKGCESGRPDDGAGCPWCGLLPGHIVRVAPMNARSSPAAPGVVYVDASLRDGVAGLAVVGALGEFSRRVSTSSSMVAERWALEWAFAIARSRDRRDLVFRSDCEGVVHQFQDGKPSRGWVVEQIPRAHNRRAHSLSVRARKPALPPVSRWSPADRSVAS